MKIAKPGLSAGAGSAMPGAAWAPAGEGETLMRLRNRGDPSGFSRVAAPIMETRWRLVKLEEAKLAEGRQPSSNSD